MNAQPGDIKALPAVIEPMAAPIRMPGVTFFNFRDDRDFLEFFLDKKGKRSAMTAKSYRFELTRFLEAFNGIPMATMTPMMLEAYCDLYKEYKPATQARIIRTIRSFFDLALRTGHLVGNPAAALDAPKVEVTSGNRFLTEWEAVRLIKAAKKGRDRIMFLLFICVGLRVAELADIHQTDFFEDAFQRIGLLVRGKGNKTRTVEIPVILWDEIQTWRPFPMDHQESDKKAHPLFPVSIRRVEQITDDTARRADIKKQVSPHWLRHTCATLATLRGATPEQVMSLLGHADPKTSMLYKHKLHALDNCATRLTTGAILGGIMAGLGD